MNQGFVWLAVIAVLTSVVGAFYYLRVVLAMYTTRAQNDGVPLKVSAPVAWAIGLCAAGACGGGVCGAGGESGGGADVFRAQYRDGAWRR